MQENNMSLGLLMDQTEVINQPVDHIWLIWATCVLTTMVNIWAIRVLKTMDDHCITRIVIWDCASNIFISVESLLFNLDVGFPLNTTVICAVRNATFLSTLMFTRLIPVAVVLLRYISVCHPVTYVNWGREKAIWKWIIGSVILYCLGFYIYNLYFSSIAFRFLRCVGREEDFG